MKKLLLLILLFIIFSCYSASFYDITPPEIIFTTFLEKDFLIQFNEPVKYLEIYTNQKRLEFINAFPKANIFLNSDMLEKYKPNNIIVKSVDTFNNKGEKEILNVFNNPDPAILSINEIRLKYTKKLNQMISFRVEKEGNLAGLQLNIFIRDKKETITFESCNVRNNEILKINFLYNKDITNRDTIDFSKSRVVNFEFNKRLSQGSSLIFVVDHKNMLLDYILYYDSKKNSLQELKNKKTFNNYLSLLKKYNITEVCYTDIVGNTSKKTIFKDKNRYLVKK
ncbi:MAG TPA: hypothetical protein PLE45_01640 [Spirochaetota bacterium]|nr:hypothetical protein [Spirochaetota bacterium]HOL57815.1 hypothetical protein [Spirochaetota bacterium]HPP04948.1 hypothetical protein [Spirochaetota bacterium]